MRRVAWWVLVVALTAATLASVAVGGWQFMAKTAQSAPVADQPSAREAAIKAASDATVKVLSYTPATFDEDNRAALALLTGNFLESYRKLTSETIRPAVLEKGTAVTTTVRQAGVESLTATSAAILLFLKQRTTSRDSEPKETTSGVREGLVKVHGSWLINSFDPV
ncbi:hypothetical protein [Mycobacterium vicinigordonae]|uniref:Twin-arginine translocation pathway signal n=1 Tax=Mycobacterium vicinigordonae TaxID=1719132 RepID=A0A7D6HRI2_9MYCO|nr:hypothetical protein [Mycobacterium vicinigordonae]QLL08231.1 hypothetical protein H0P51_04490 [Mycobacterium vicinigordonae]